MPLRPSFGPLRPDLDRFLHAAVGEERDGVPLTMISALARLDLDPWDEAGRLSSLAKPEAGAQLAQMIVRLTGTRWLFPEARRIADGLIELLPGRAQLREAAGGSRATGRTAPRKMFWIVCLLIVAAALVSMAASGDRLFGNRAPSEPLGIASGIASGTASGIASSITPPENSRPPMR